MRAEKEGDRIVLSAPPTYTARVKEVPGGRWDSKARLWRFPVSWGVCVMLRGVFGDELEVGPALAEWSRNEYETRVSPALRLREMT